MILLLLIVYNSYGVLYEHIYYMSVYMRAWLTFVRVIKIVCFESVLEPTAVVAFIFINLCTM